MNKTKIIKIKAILFAYYQAFLIFISKNLNKPLNKPTSITLTVTNNCNSHCQHCHLWQSKPEKQLKFSQAKKILDKLHHWLGNFYLFFTGGEPFLNHDLPKIIKYAQKKGIICHVNSNALLINKSLAKKIIDSKLNSISISLDGAKPLTNDYIRGIPNGYEKVMQAMKLLKNGPEIYLNTVIMEPNVNQLISLIKLSKNIKASGIHFQNLLPTLSTKDTIKDMQQSSLWPKYKNLKLQIKKINKLNKIQKEKLIDNNNYLQQIIDYYRSPFSATKNIICTAGINNFIINKNGNVQLCFDFPSVGNIFKESPKNIWLNKNAQQQRKIIRRCQKLCKVTTCNQIDINRQIKVDSQNL